jgi:hypothetical protein
MTTKAWTAWTPEEDAVLRGMWAESCSLKELMHRLPGRSYRATIAHGQWLGLGRRVNFKKSRYSPTWEAINAVLADKRMRSAIELARETGASRRAVMQQLADHHGKDVRIAGYLKSDGVGCPMALWKLGNGKDVPRLAPTPKSVIYKRQYKRLKTERPDLLAARNAQMRLRYAERTGKLIRPDPATIWLKVPPEHHAEPLRPEHYRDNPASAAAAASAAA